MARVQDVSRRVVDVEEDGVEAPAGCLRVEAALAVGQGEEVALLQADRGSDASSAVSGSNAR